MMRFLLLDSGPLGKITNPKATPDNDACKFWLRSQVAAGTTIIVPEIADYEVRRELLRDGKIKGLARLDAFKNATHFLPINSDTMLKAAELWASARHMGKKTADDKSLDGDMILVAQALDVEHTLKMTPPPRDVEVIIATTNTKHLELFVNAREWQSIA